MNINATLFVQAFNFMIVYWMLRIFLFKPAITIIEDEKVQEWAMIDIIEQQIKSLEIQEKERQRHWYICREYFKTHQPPLLNEASFFADDAEYIIEPPVSLSPDAIAHIIADASSVIEEKIKHVH